MSISTTAVRIGVTLKDVVPQVTRRLAVPLGLRLDRLHATLQAAFGWTDSHLFAFQAGGATWGIPDGEGDRDVLDARKCRLYDVIRETGTKTIHYIYDFGDNWDHVIKLEKWFENTVVEGLPLLLEASGRTPPEDIGGAQAYAEYLKAMADPSHPEHHLLVDRGSAGFDPGMIDRKALERAVDVLAEQWIARPRKSRSKPANTGR